MERNVQDAKWSKLTEAQQEVIRHQYYMYKEYMNNLEACRMLEEKYGEHNVG